MIELNLLPPELRKKSKFKAELPDIPTWPIVAGIAAILVVSNLFLSVIVGNKRANLKRLENQWDQMGPQRMKTEKIAKELALLTKRSAVIGKIAKPDLEWSTLLSGLNEAIIPNIWLARFDMNIYVPEDPLQKKQNLPKKEVFLEIGGYALGRSEQATSRIAKFITSLKKNNKFSQYFDDIELEGIKNRKLSGEEVMMFELMCRLKAPEEVLIAKSNDKS